VWHKGIVSNQRVGQTANFNFRSSRNQSFANAVYLATNSSFRAIAPGSRAKSRRAEADRMVHPGVRVATGVALALLLAVGLAVGTRNTPLDQATAYSLALCATLLVSPLAWGHYYMIQLPALLCVPLWLSWRGMPRLAGIVAALPPVLSWTYYVGMPYTGELGILGLGTALWFVLACGCILGIESTAPFAASSLSRTRMDSGRAGLYHPLGIGGRLRHPSRRTASHDYSGQERRSKR
jgi:hypothetical protein